MPQPIFETLCSEVKAARDAEKAARYVMDSAVASWRAADSELKSKQATLQSWTDQQINGAAS